jgi:hypothetical protein
MLSATVVMPPARARATRRLVTPVESDLVSASNRCPSIAASPITFNTSDQMTGEAERYGQAASEHQRRGAGKRTSPPAIGWTQAVDYERYSADT